MQQVINAEEDILSGDSAYLSGEFEKAVASYKSAYSRLTEGDKTKSLREAVRERYAQAAVESAKEMNRKGRRTEAIALMDEVLSSAVYPDYVPAQLMREKLEDPIRTNPAATVEHVQNVDEVRRLLYTADGAFNLADYDKAYETYKKVLRIDPYNKAARRGMETVSVAISSYTGSAYDHLRAELLKDVDAAWELPEKNTVEETLLVTDVGAIGDGALAHGLQSKLDSIIFPFVAFDDSTLREAIDYLEAQSRNLDTGFNEEDRGVGFVVDMGTGDSPEAREILARRFSFQLRNVPLRQVLEYVNRQTATRYRVDAHAVVVSPLSGDTDTLVLRRYVVPPAFMTQGKSNAATVDIFGEGGVVENKLAPRLSAREILEEAGVSFPDGATASYNSAIGELFVKNTDVNHELIEQILDALLAIEPIQVVIEAKILRIKQENIEELMADWIVNDLSLGESSEFHLNGGTSGNGRNLNEKAVTSGLRSGDFAFDGDGLLDLVNRDSSTRGKTLRSAPGFLSALGYLDETSVTTLLRGLKNKKGVDLMTQPSVVTRSGEQALISAGREFTYPTEYEPPELPNSIGTTVFVDFSTGQVSSPPSFAATPSHPTAFQTRTIGTQLEVQPIVSEDRKTVDLVIKPTISEFLGFINYGEPLRGGNTQASFAVGGGLDVAGQTGNISANDILIPLFDTVTATTHVTIASNHTIVIGGLISESVEKVEDKVPVLGDLPLIGGAFRSNSQLRQKEIVMILVTARIVDPGGNPVPTN